MVPEMISASKSFLISGKNDVCIEVKCNSVFKVCCGAST